MEIKMIISTLINLNKKFLKTPKIKNLPLLIQPKIKDSESKNHKNLKFCLPYFNKLIAMVKQKSKNKILKKKKIKKS
jgi:hypothetical protein